MSNTIAMTTLVVRDYEEALDFYVGKLGFQVLEDRPVPEQDKRWLVVGPSGGGALLLARAAGPQQTARIGKQAGDRVMAFLHSDDFWRDYRAFRARGVQFMENPREEAYGTVAVFRDLYGNRWDLLQLADEPETRA